jgi:hypothetical protein
LAKLAPRLFLCVSFLLVVGCGTSDNIRLAENGVTQVHAQMDNGQFLQIYAQADPGLRSATKQQDFLDFVGAVHRKLGKVQTATRASYFVNFTTSGTRVRLNYETKFEGGDAQEEFVWKIKGQDVVLLGYHINSTALILK